MKIKIRYFDYCDNGIEAVDKDEFISLIKNDIEDGYIKCFGFKPKVDVVFANIAWNDFNAAYQLKDEVEYTVECDEATMHKFLVDEQKLSFNDPEIRFNGNSIETRNELNPDWNDISEDGMHAPISKYEIVER